MGDRNHEISPLIIAEIPRGVSYRLDRIEQIEQPDHVAIEGVREVFSPEHTDDPDGEISNMNDGGRPARQLNTATREIGAKNRKSGQRLHRPQVIEPKIEFMVSRRHCRVSHDVHRFNVRLATEDRGHRRAD